MSSERDLQRLQDIIVNADRIASHLTGFDLAAFRADPRTIDAVERCLQRITEAVIQLGPEATALFDPSLPWHDVRSLGNRLRHDYRRIEQEVIFRTATVQVPALRDAVARVVEL